jgi:hypothetical protein
MKVRWGPRAVPLAPRAVYADGEAARALVRRLLAAPDEELARLRGVSAPDFVLVLGDDLPWVDGARYLGTDPLAPALLLPTARAPSVSPALLARAFGGTFAVVPDPPRLVPFTEARVLSRAKLEAFLA